MAHSTKLPTQFKSWTDFYLLIKKNIPQHCEIFAWHEHQPFILEGSTTVIHKTYSVIFVKEQAFNELLAEKDSNSEFTFEDMLEVKKGLEYLYNGYESLTSVYNKVEGKLAKLHATLHSRQS